MTVNPPSFFHGWLDKNDARMTPIDAEAFGHRIKNLDCEIFCDVFEEDKIFLSYKGLWNHLFKRGEVGLVPNNLGKGFI